jgi:hypothetical protein
MRRFESSGGRRASGAEEPAFGYLGGGEVGGDDADDGAHLDGRERHEAEQVDPRPKKGVARANAVAATVVQSRRALGRLRHAGPRVRRTSTTPSSVSNSDLDAVPFRPDRDAPQIAKALFPLKLPLRIDSDLLKANHDDFLNRRDDLKKRHFRIWKL